MLHEHFFDGVTIEHSPPCAHFIKDAAEGVDVRPNVDFPRSKTLLRRHIGRRSAHRACSSSKARGSLTARLMACKKRNSRGVFMEASRNTEVRDFDRAFMGDEDILRFQVAMYEVQA